MAVIFQFSRLLLSSNSRPSVMKDNKTWHINVSHSEYATISPSPTVLPSFNYQVTRIHLNMLLILMIAVLAAPAMSSELKILDSPDGRIGPAPCALTCSGIGRWNVSEPFSYSWTISGDFPGKAYKLVSLKDCSFVSPPVVTATVKGPGPCPLVRMRGVLRTYFSVYTVEDVTLDAVKDNECDVHWIATGYNC